MPDDPNIPNNPNNPPSQFLERKLATILSADVAEFSRLMGEDEEQTLRTFRGHKQVFESLVVLHRGRVFNTAGDAILAEFTSAVEAVRCATDIQTALRTLNDKLPPSRQVRFRIGINLGDVMVQDQDLLGDGVNVAARLQTAAEPGGICISGSVHDQIRNKLSLSFHSLGDRTYKNIPQPVRTFSVSESEEGTALPSPKSARASSSALKWLAAAVVLLLAGGGYWAYSTHHHSQPEPAASTSTAAPAPPLALTPSPAASAGTNASAAQPQPAPSPAPAIPTAPAPLLKPQPAKPSGTPHSNTALATPPAAQPLPAAAAGPNDGLYAGPVCFGETKLDSKRCFRAQGIVSGDKITGRWSMHQDKDVTMVLLGTITPAGDVTIEMHSKKSDGSPLANINLKGTLVNGRLDTEGSFLMGRPATLNWHKLPPPAN